MPAQEEKGGAFAPPRPVLASISLMNRAHRARLELAAGAEEAPAAAAAAGPGRPRQPQPPIHPRKSALAAGAAALQPAEAAVVEEDRT